MQANLLFYSTSVVHKSRLDFQDDDDVALAQNHDTKLAPSSSLVDPLSKPNLLGANGSLR